jgi:hypothetical protein
MKKSLKKTMVFGMLLAATFSSSHSSASNSDCIHVVYTACNFLFPATSGPDQNASIFNDCVGFGMKFCSVKEPDSINKFRVEARSIHPRLLDTIKKVENGEVMMKSKQSIMRERDSGNAKQKN